MSMNNLTVKVAQTFKRKFSSLLQTSRSPTPEPTDMDSSSDNNVTATHAGARWATESCCPMLHWLLTYAFPCASISCAPDTTVTEPDPTLPQISSPASPRIVNTLSESPSMVNIIFISLTIVVHRNQLLSIKHVSLPTNALSSMVPKMCTCIQLASADNVYG